MSGNLSSEQVTDVDIYEELNEQEETISQEQREKEEWKQLLKKRKTKKGRIDIERMFIGKVMYYAGRLGDSCKYVLDFKISWRKFIDARHKVIWRVLETYDLLSTFEREKIVEGEAYEKVRQGLMQGVYYQLQDYGGTCVFQETSLPVSFLGTELRDNCILDGEERIDIIKGFPGSAAENLYKKYLGKETVPVKWLDRILESIDALAIAGGKVYLWEIAGKDCIFTDTKLADLLFKGCTK